MTDFHFQNWFLSITKFTRFQSKRFWILSIFQLWYPWINIILWYFCIYIIHYGTNNNGTLKIASGQTWVNLLIDHNSFSKLKPVKSNSSSFVWIFDLQVTLFCGSTGAPLNEKKPFTDEDTAALYYNNMNMWSQSFEKFVNILKCYGPLNGISRVPKLNLTRAVVINIADN